MGVKMRLVKLSANSSVNPEYVVSVHVVEMNVVVTTTHGQQFHINRDFNKTVWQTKQRIEDELAEENSPGGKRGEQDDAISVAE